MLWSGSAARRHSTKMSGFSFSATRENESPTPALAHVLNALRTALRATFSRTSLERSPKAYVKVRRFQAQRVLKKGDGPPPRSATPHRGAAIKSRVGVSRI